MNFIENKVYYITGASSGIGKATATRILEQGGKVFDFSRRRALTDSMQHPNLRSIQGDVASEEDVRNGFEACIASFGTVDVLINNAGVGFLTTDLSETDVALYDQMMNVNMRGVFLCNREALKIMKANQDGHIITVISMAGYRTNPNAPVYCASKFGARGLSSGLADQAIKLGIKVTDINPGPTDSDYWGDRKVPREKFLQPDDVARVICFVLSQPPDVLIREINFDNIRFLKG